MWIRRAAVLGLGMALALGTVIPATASAQSAGPVNDAFAAAQAITGTNGTITGSNVGATLEPGEPKHAGSAGGASIWYRWQAPASGQATISTVGSGFDTLLGIYTGADVSALTSVAANDDISGSVYQSSATFAAVAGTTYRIAIDGWRNNAGVAATGAATLSWSLGPPPATPANDAFGDAQPISGPTGAVTGTTVNATKQAGEPNHLPTNAGGASIWYRWVAPSNGRATITTTGSAFDTVLAAYTGTSVSALTSIASNDDISGSVYQSSITFDAVVGTTYQIAIDGWRTGGGVTATGATTLDWSLVAAADAPANDTFADARTITGATGSVAGTTVGATKQAGEPDHAGSVGGASVWYRWVAPSSGRMIVSTAGSAFDTVMATYTGGSVSNLTPVGSNDDMSSAIVQSRMAFDAVAGREYRIALDGFRNNAGVVATGATTLTWSLVGSGGPVLAAAGDVASCFSAGGANTASLLSMLPTATVAMLGDAIEPEGTADAFANCYDPSWGQAKSRTRPTIGHHDYVGTSADDYYAYYGAAAGDPSKGYYSYDLGTWHIVVLNSMCSKVPGGCAKDSPQERWLRADLAAHKAKCTLAYWHTPLFGSGEDGTDPAVFPLWKTLDDKHADVILNGHDHLYERFAPQKPDGRPDQHGIREFIAGTGGIDISGFGPIARNSQVRDATTQGILALTLRTNGYDWQFVPAGRGTFTDSGSGSCHD